MIKKLEDVHPSNYQKSFIVEFIQKSCPFSENNSRLQYLIEEFLNKKMDVPVSVGLNETEIDPETKENKIKFFMLWLNGTNLYSGTAFIKEAESTRGINFGDYESIAS